MERQTLIRAVATTVAAAVIATLGWVAVADAAGGPNLALGKATAASSSNGPYVTGNVNDGNQATYWESSGALPQWVRVDLGAPTSIDQVVLKLPAGWGSRTQTLSVQGSADGSSYTDLAAATGHAFNPASNNAVTVNFAAANPRYVRVHITANTGWAAAQLSELEIYGTTGSTSNLAAGRPTSESGHADGYASGNVVDGNQGSYWESVNNAWPQWVQVDLGSSVSISRVVLKVPTTWGTRQQTLSVRGSVDGSTFTDLVGSTPYTFNPASVGNSVTITFTATSQRYVRIQFTANSVWPAGQLSELEVYGSSGPVDTTAPSVPGTLAYTVSGTTITLTWGASTDNADGSGLAGYNVYRNNTLITPVLGTVLTFADTQPASATVSYFVRARDNAGNLSGNSNTVTRTGNPGNCVNVALNKPVTATGSTFTFVPANATDGAITTYWEGSAVYPQNLTVALGANHVVTSVNVKLNPDPAWGTRTQNFQILGRAQTATGYTNLVAAATYQFNQGSNVVTVPVSATTADVQLRFNSNSGAPSGQVAEFEVCGTPAPNPDLTVGSVGWTPASPNETSAITLTATVNNTGDLASTATTVNFWINGTLKGTASVPAVAAGGSAPVSLAIGSLGVGSYVVSATVDPANTVFEKNEDNNTAAAATSMSVAPAPGPDLQVLSITSNPQNPAVGAAVSFTVAVNNRGTTSAGASITRLAVGTTTLNTNTGAIPAGTTATVAVTGTWTATSGGATITATTDATNTVAETREDNNTLTRSIVVGRGAAVPWVEYEAEAASYQGTLLTTDPLRTFGHTNFATESSGRESVRLNSTGQFVEFTSTNQANSIVVRNSIPDAPGGGGQEATISLYINGSFAQKITLSSRNSWLYGTTDDTESLSNTPSADARRLFDESHALLSQSWPAGTRFKLQRDANDPAQFYIIDLIDLEQVAPAASQPAGCTSITTYGAVPNDGNDDTAAIQRAVTDDQNGVISCVWIPAGQWRQEQKILSPDPARGQFNQRGIRDVVIRGAGMWHSQLYTQTQPQNVVGSINHPHEGNVGFDIDDNTQISDIAIFGMTTNRANRGHGLNGRFGRNTRISNVWIEHTNVGAWVGRDFSDTPAYWNPGDGLEFSGMRIRNTYADGINFSNGTRNSRAFNSSFRNTGDDSLAVWANPFVRDQAVDIAHDNHFVNNTVQLVWRANGIAIYGGYNNSIENNLIYDTMNYPGIMLATDHSPLPFSGTTLIANNGLYRTGGAFWNEDQEFGAITLFPSGRDIVGVTIRDTDISDSTYDGIQFKTGGGNMAGVVITNVRIDRSNNGSGILAMGGARGNATLSNVTISNSRDGNILIEPGSSFTITGG